MGISLGIAGLGAFGSTFAHLFKRHPLVDRIALCDREPERVKRFACDPSFQDKFTATDAYDSLEELCASNLSPYGPSMGGPFSKIATDRSGLPAG